MMMNVQKIKNHLIGLTGNVFPKELMNIRSQHKIFIFYHFTKNSIYGKTCIDAQKVILQKAFPMYRIIEFSLCNIYLYKNALKKAINEDDIITFLEGTDIFSDEVKIIVKHFAKNKIVFFPTKIRRNLKSFYKKLDFYLNFDNILLFLNNEDDFNNIITLAPNSSNFSYYFSHRNNKNNNPTSKVEYCPSILFSDDKFDESIKREIVIIALENELKSNVSDSNKINFIKTLIEEFDDFMFPPKDSSDIIDVFSKINTAKLVLTDNLETMVFCAITKTPALIICDQNCIITSVYNEHLKNFNYLRLLTNDSDFRFEINFLLNLKNKSFSFKEFEKYFENLVNVIKKI